MSLLTIDIVICTYNNANLLDQTLTSLVQQQQCKAERWSVVVIDNNSTDHTHEIVQKHIAVGSIPSLRLVRESQQGLSYARRRAVLETTGDFLAFVDDDCLLAPDWIQQVFSFCHEHPNAGAVGGKVQLLWEKTPDNNLRRFAGYLAEQHRGDKSQILPLSGPTYLVGAGLVVRRSALEASGWLDKMILKDRAGKSLTAGGDSEIVLRIRNAGYELWYNPAMQLEHYIPQHRISVDYFCRLLRGIG
ncbi:MAG: glycosyltransferase family 2 protein, partial [Anaerolineae bacterium]|nr:glycosyltransferase family 2 protein [Anaerolineae bacterium]